jgi:hypothetical protein
MDGNALRQRAGLWHGAGRQAVELAASKLRPPLVPPGSVRRPALIDRLRQGRSFPVMSVVAPAGYGKTTLLSQWAELDGQAFAWVSLDERDNDPKVLLTYVAEALNAVEPVAQRVFDALASPGSSVPGSVVPRLGSALASMTSPVALVLDDVHVLDNPECRAAMPVLADHVPNGSQLVLAGRDAPPVPVARLRAAGRILEVGPRDLALTLAEASALLREAGITLGREDVAELHRRTEGWPAGLYLAALSLREGGSLGDAVASFIARTAITGRPGPEVLDVPASARSARRWAGSCGCPPGRLWSVSCQTSAGGGLDSCGHGYCACRWRAGGVAGGGLLGVTAAPFIGSGPAAAVDLARRAERLGYESAWVAEVLGRSSWRLRSDPPAIRPVQPIW